MKKYFRQFKWFRKMTGGLYYFVDNKWIINTDFKKGDKLEKAEGWKHSLNWCSCGNELSHSDSYVSELDNGVWDYKCSHCGKQQYKNAMLGPFIIECDKTGKPL